VRSCASTVAVKDVCTYNVVPVFKDVVAMCLQLMLRMYLYRYISGTELKGGCL